MNMKHKTIIALCAAFFAAALSLNAEDTKAADSANLRDFISAKLAAGQKQIKIPAGVYRLGMADRAAILKFENLEDVSIDARGVELICLNTIRAIAIRNCKNFKLEGLTIDYDPLTFSQGKIVWMSDDKMQHEIELFEGYPTTESISDEKYEIFTPDTRILRTMSYYLEKIEVLSPTRFKIYKKSHFKGNPEQVERVGDLIVINARNVKNAAPHGITIENSENIVMDSVTLYASNCFGFYEAYCKNNLYKNCKIDRRPAAIDIAPRASARLRSMSADAYHCRFTNKGPTYDGCSAFFMGDDAVAVSGGYHLISKVDGKKLRVLARHNGSMDIAAGDDIEILYFDGSKVERAKAVKVSRAADKNATAEEKDWIKGVKRWPLFEKPTTLTEAFDVELDAPTAAMLGSMIISSNQTGEGYKVINCRFGFARARGIIVKAPNGLIKNNTLEGIWLDSITMHPEWYWFGGGHSKSVVVEGNKIIAGMHPAISIYSNDIRAKVFLPAGAHQNIVVKNNDISYYYAPAVFITSVDGLTYEDNTLHKLEAPVYAGRVAKFLGQSKDEPEIFINCINN